MKATSICLFTILCLVSAIQFLFADTWNCSPGQTWVNKTNGRSEDCGWADIRSTESDGGYFTRVSLKCYEEDNKICYRISGSVLYTDITGQCNPGRYTVLDDEEIEFEAEPE